LNRYARQHVLEMSRRTLPDEVPRRLDRLADRLTKIVAEAHKLPPPEKSAEIGRLSRALGNGA
jgi:hypothetical protein